MNSKEFKCDEPDCWKSFDKRSTLYHHKRTHTKPFKCDLCEKSYAQKWQLSAHRRHHTGNVYMVRVQCANKTTSKNQKKRL